MCRKHCQSGLAPSSANRREPLCKKLYGVQGNPQPYRKTSRGQHVTWYDSIWFLSFKSLLFHSSYYDCSVPVLAFHVTIPYVLILHVMIPHVIPSLWTEFSRVDLEYVLVGPYYPKKIACSICSMLFIWKILYDVWAKPLQRAVKVLCKESLGWLVLLRIAPGCQAVEKRGSQGHHACQQSKTFTDR